jgi:hypothetical protein
MPNEPTQDADKLRKLGQRVRDGFAKGHPVPEKSLETVRDAVRKEWEKERAAASPARIRARALNSPVCGPHLRKSQKRYWRRKIAFGDQKFILLV